MTLEKLPRRQDYSMEGIRSVRFGTGSYELLRMFNSRPHDYRGYVEGDQLFDLA